MKHYLSLTLILAALLLTVASCNTQTTPPIREAVRTQNGLVSGTHDESTGITSFKGIPFAAPPVGDLRWKAPQPAASWEGVKECTEFSASPIQGTPVPFMMWTQEFIAPAEPLSEDCLYLNVWTGAQEAGEKRPVFVYIYGGGFTSGSGAVPIYDGEEMAKKGLVFLTINYRVGVMGFLAHPELTAETSYQSSGNYGLLDQIEALKWVNKNIEAFGGDPGNVTIAGQSAGAFAVNYLVASPLTRGLIHRAIAESGGSIASNQLARGSSLEDAEQAGTEYAASLEAASIADLRALPAEEILAKRGPSSPIVDGYVIPEDMYTIFAEGKQNDVPLILGWNQDEGFGAPATSLEDFEQKINGQFGEDAGEFLRMVDVESDEEATALDSRLLAMQTFGIQSYVWMKLQNRSGNSGVYIYNFERDVPYAEGMQDHGAFHTGEVPYAYNNLKMSPRPWQEADYKLADAMSDYWVNFAANGDPNGEGLPHWEPCTPDNPKAMILDEQIELMDLPDQEILEFLEKLYAK